MLPKQAFKDIIADLPWVDRYRIVVGSLASRETVKDALLDEIPVVPSWAIGTLSEFATQLLKDSKITTQSMLSFSSQCDALEYLAKSNLLKTHAPKLSAHMRARPVVAKIARFLSQLDRFYVTTDDREALVEYFEGKDKSLSVLLRVVSHLWDQDEFLPFSEGHVLRQTLEALESGRLQKLPQEVWLWAFQEFTPLEETLLERLGAQGVKLKFTAPESLCKIFESRAKPPGFEFVALDSPQSAKKTWRPHSVWDELSFLKEKLQSLRAQGVEWREIALFVPQDDLYKRIVRQKLREWNVPLLDPTLSGAWKDEARWVWWRDFFRALAGGLKVEDVRAWLGNGERRRQLLELVHRLGVHAGAKSWMKISGQVDIPELKILVESVDLFGRVMGPEDFRASVEKLIPRVEEILGPGLEFDTPLILDFARHLVEDRPYLAQYRARLPRYVALFEEFLEAKARTLSLRSQEGVRFVAHGVWLPQPVKHAFALGLNLLARPKPPHDLWDWEGLEVRQAWNKLHFGMPWQERMARDEVLLEHALTGHAETTFSCLSYGLDGAPLPKASALALQISAAPTECEGGHAAVGWNLKLHETWSDEGLARIERPDLAPQFPLSVSAFEDYLRCPFLFYSRHVLKLNREDKLGLDPDARARGTVLHRALEEFLKREMASQPLTSLEEARKKLRDLISVEVRKNKLPGMYRHEPLVKKAVSVIQASGDRWLEWEFENRKKHPGLRPIAVELPIEVELAEGVRLKGKIDRVDSDGKHCVVIDYKSSSAPFIGNEIRQGIGAQLLVYARGVEVARKLEPAAAFYLSLGRKIDSSKGVFFKKFNKQLHTTHARNSGLVDGEFGTLFEQVSEKWTQAAEQLKKGDFHPNPARGRKECVNCAYQKICGHEGEPQDGQ
ncbi:MAG: PD-(D/E)XK nuclease family protein [Bdellovibrionota bacterium]